MNRIKPNVRETPHLPTPGEIGEDTRPFAPAVRPGLISRSGRAEPARDIPRPEPTQPPPQRSEEGKDDDSECFDPESTDYKAFGWAGNKTVPSLSVILKDGTALGINYGDIASAYPGGSMFLPSAPGCKGNVIRLRVAGDAGAFMAVLEGRRLWRGWELLMGHKTPWIRELPEGMDVIGGSEPVIWTIAFSAIKG
jgi:hypothetical protein